jgi:hypothetical protein
VRRIVSIVALLTASWALKFAWNTITAVPVAPPLAIERAAETDVRVAQDLREGNAAPARGWLAGADHLAFEGHAAAMNEWIEAFHAAGAERVWMVEIGELADRQISDAIAVELPPAGVARDRIFSVEARLRGGVRSPDVGQQYLRVAFD